MQTTPTSDEAATRDGKDGPRAKSLSPFRQYAGHIRLNTTRASLAQPPPTSQPQIPQGRGKEEQAPKEPNRTGCGGDVDGSSDSNDRGRRERGEGSHGPSLRRLIPQSSPPDSTAPDFRNRSHEAEEGKLFHTPRDLHQFEEGWGDKLMYRTRKRAEGEQLRRSLARSLGEASTQPELLDLVRKQEEALKDYLDESLFSAIAEDRFRNTDRPNTEIPIASPEVVARLIRDAEDQVIQIIQEALKGRGKLTPEFVADPRGHISAGVRSLSSSWEYLANVPDLSFDNKVDIITGFLLHDAAVALGLQTSTIASACLKGIVIEIVESFSSNASEYEPRQSFLQGWSDSEYLSPDYIDWVWSNCDPARLKHVILEDQGYKRQHVRERIERFRESMSAVQISVAQEFFMANDSTVGMGLLKNGHASTLKMVSSEDLYKMGWRRSEGGEYWRCAGFDDQPDLVFRVNMDGEVLDLVRSLDWYRAVVG